MEHLGACMAALFHLLEQFQAFVVGVIGFSGEFSRCI